MKIAIASGKGGTGKTTVAVNLASYLAETRPVVLVDLDVEEPNSGLFLGDGDPAGRHAQGRDTFKMIPSWEGDACSHCGQCQQVCNFHAIIELPDQVMIFPELCHSCYACSELCPTSSLPMQPLKMGRMSWSTMGNLFFIESRLDIGQEQAVPLIKQTLAFAAERGDPAAIHIYDCPPGTSCPVIEAVGDADFVLLVTEPTPFGLHDLKLAVETMRHLDKACGVIINRDGIGDGKVVDYCRDEDIPILARIPNDRRIAESYARGQRIYEHFPRVRNQLTALVDALPEVES